MARKSEKIKILYTIPNFDTAGSGKALLKLATQLDKTIFEPHIACMHKKGVFFKEVANSGIPVHIIQYTTRMKPYYKGIFKCFKIAKQFKDINPTIIHSFHYGADYSEALSARLAGIRWIYTKKNMNWGGSSKNSWFLRTFLAKHIIYQNTDMKKQFFSTHQNISMISRGVDLKEFYITEKDNTLLKKYNFSNTDRILITVANLVPLKGIDVLIQAFYTSNIFEDNWKLLIVGNDNNAYGDVLKQLVNDLSLSASVIFAGKQLNVNAHLSLAELFVLPTVYKGEGSPVALLEAMAAGKTVLGSNMPGIKDQLKDHPDHLIEAGNIALWANKLKEFSIKDPEELDRIGTMFQKEVLAYYQLNKEVERTEDVYLSICK